MSGIKDAIERMTAERARESEVERREEESRRSRVEIERATRIKECARLLEASGAVKVFEELKESVLEGKAEIETEEGTRNSYDIDGYTQSRWERCFALAIVRWPDQRNPSKSLKIIAEAYCDEHHYHFYVSGGVCERGKNQDLENKAFDGISDYTFNETASWFVHLTQ